MQNPTLPSLKDVIKGNELWAEKKFGQNFITDLNITRKIALQAPITSKSTVVEVGPGPGGLTRALLDLAPHKLIAIEFDKRCIDALTYLTNVFPNLEILHADALKIQMKDLGSNLTVVANLPYNISTALLTTWLKTPTQFTNLVLMFQKEVAERLIASPRTKSYGRLSILTQWLMDVRLCFDLPPSVFTPAPKITSSVVRLTPKGITPTLDEFRAMEIVTAAAFGQRRKMLRSSLKNTNVPVNELIAKAGILETARAEELDVQEFIHLSQVYLELSRKP